MSGIVSIELRETFALLLFFASGMFRPDPPDAGYFQSRATGIGRGHKADRRLLFPGVCDLRNERQVDLRSASCKVEVAVKRRRERSGHRLVDGEVGVDGDPILVRLDEGPV